MKKLALILLMLSISSTAIADEHHHGHHGHHGGYDGGHRGGNNDWILPAIIGTAIVGGAMYEYGRPTPPPTYYYPPAPVYQQAPPIYPAVPYEYHQQSVFDPSCNCYKYALVPN